MKNIILLATILFFSGCCKDTIQYVYIPQKCIIPDVTIPTYTKDDLNRTYIERAKIKKENDVLKDTYIEKLLEASKVCK